jgi:hypothetical protein
MLNQKQPEHPDLNCVYFCELLRGFRDVEPPTLGDCEYLLDIIIILKFNSELRKQYQQPDFPRLYT